MYRWAPVLDCFIILPERPHEDDIYEQVAFDTGIPVHQEAGQASELFSRRGDSM
jgi:hypothetical protein